MKNNKEIQHEMNYLLGTKFRNISENALDNDSEYEIAIIKENDDIGIGFLTPSGHCYSHLIYVNNCENVKEISKEDFSKICANNCENFEYVG